MSIHFCSSGGSVVFFDLRVVLAELRDVLSLFPATAGLGVSSVASAAGWYRPY